MCERHVGRLDKRTLVKLVETSCARRAMWEVGRGDARWVRGGEQPEPPDFQRDDGRVLMELGREFEQEVYALLSSSALEVRAARGPQGDVVSRRLDAAGLRELVEAARARHDGVIVALEHELETPQSLLRWLLGLGEEDEVPVARPSASWRPDVLIVEASPPAREGELWLGADGIARPVPQGDARATLRFMDAKHTHEQSVGRRQLIELLFYAHAAARFVAEHGLEDVLRVTCHGHAIIPQLHARRAYVAGLEHLDAQVVPLVWRDEAHLITATREALMGLWAQAPLDVDAVDVHVQPACGRCPFFNDCAARMGAAGAPAQMDVRLMPYTSTSLAEQLRERGVQTVGQLPPALAEWPIEPVPTPLNTERPMLAMKARALLMDAQVFPDEQSQHHLSVALPRRSEIKLGFCAEKDPIHDRLFAFGLSMQISCPDRLAPRWAGVHDALWVALADALGHRRVEEVNVEVMLDALDPDARRLCAAQSDDGDEDAQRAREVMLLRAMVEALFVLRARGELEIRPPQDGRHAWVRWSCAEVSTGLQDMDERQLTRKLVQRAVRALEVIALTERLVCAPFTFEGRDGQPVELLDHPGAALFYWSREQADHLRELIERHLAYLTTSAELSELFGRLMHLIVPADSGVRHEYEPRKIYDVREFVETTSGLPQHINYTWHDVARRLLNGFGHVPRRFWMPHFNHMSFAVWHQAMLTQERAELDQIARQATLKATTILRLVTTLQSRGGYHGAIWRGSKPVSSAHIWWRERDASDAMHPLARAWLRFDRLQTASQAQQAQDVRLTFPLKSIGQLKAAEVTRWRVRRDEQGTTLRLELEGLSTNVGFKPGAQVLLLHQDARDARRPARFYQDNDRVVLGRFEWSEDGQRVTVIASPASDQHPLLSADAPARGWMLYPNAMDAWGGKLDRALAEHNLGTSWLGQHVAFELGLIGVEESLIAPDSLAFDVAEVTMYAPHLLPTASPVAPAHVQAHPAPDPSQRDAIATALASPVSCIQGPPGTGKSQTIAALIEEFVARRGPGPVRVLVASFSYEPCRVVARKVLEHRDASGQPTAAAALPQLFLRSGSREDGPGDTIDLVIDGSRLFIGGEQLNRRKKSLIREGARQRLEDVVGERMVMYGVTHQLQRLLTAKGGVRQHVHEDFCFDLIIVDEASQVPVDHTLVLMPLLRPARVVLDGVQPGEVVQSVDQSASLRVARVTDMDGASMSPEALTRLVFVGDHHQLPPVQPVAPPRRLAPVLGSAFGYFAGLWREEDAARVPIAQLSVNYRSSPSIVAYTNSLGLYDRHIEAFHQGPHAYTPLPEPPADAPDWAREVLSPGRPLSALLHASRFDTAVSPAEIALITTLSATLLRQLAPATPDEEARFWADRLGIVSPHNAQGRALIQAIHQHLLAEDLTRLTPEALREALEGTIYSVERFQGSARDVIIASMGVSAVDQIQAEEAFLFQMNRLNVLTSRARQKMVLVCSQQLVDTIPARREVSSSAARLRDFALVTCGASRQISVEAGERAVPVTLRWQDPSAPASPASHAVVAPADPPEPPGAPGATPPTSGALPLDELLAQLQRLPPEQRAALLSKLGGGS